MLDRLIGNTEDVENEKDDLDKSIVKAPKMSKSEE